MSNMDFKPRRLPPMAETHNKLMEVIISPTVSDMDSKLELLTRQPKYSKKKSRASKKSIQTNLKRTSSKQSPTEDMSSSSFLFIKKYKSNEDLLTTPLKALKLRREKIVSDYVLKEQFRKQEFSKSRIGFDHFTPISSPKKRSSGKVSESLETSRLPTPSLAVDISVIGTQVKTDTTGKTQRAVSSSRPNKPSFQNEKSLLKKKEMKKDDRTKHTKDPISSDSSSEEFISPYALKKKNLVRQKTDSASKVKSKLDLQRITSKNSLALSAKQDRVKIDKGVKKDKETEILEKEDNQSLDQSSTNLQDEAALPKLDSLTKSESTPSLTKMAIGTTSGVTIQVEDTTSLDDWQPILTTTGRSPHPFKMHIEVTDGTLNEVEMAGIILKTMLKRDVVKDRLYRDAVEESNVPTKPENEPERITSFHLVPYSLVSQGPSYQDASSKVGTFSTQEKLQQLRNSKVTNLGERKSEILLNLATKDTETGKQEKVYGIGKSKKIDNLGFQKQRTDYRKDSKDLKEEEILSRLQLKSEKIMAHRDSGKINKEEKDEMRQELKTTESLKTVSHGTTKRASLGDHLENEVVISSKNDLKLKSLKDEKSKIKRDSFRKEMDEKDKIKRDSFKKEMYEKDQIKRDSFKKEMYEKDNKKRDSFKEETDEKDQIKRDSFKKEMYEKDNKKRDSFKEEIDEKDQIKRDSFKEEMYEKDQIKRDSFKKEMYEKDNIKRDSFKEEMDEKDQIKFDSLMEEMNEKDRLKHVSFKEKTKGGEIVHVKQQMSEEERDETITVHLGSDSSIEKEDDTMKEQSGPDTSQEEKLETKRDRLSLYSLREEGDETKRGRDRRYDSMKEGDETKRGRERRYDSMKEGDETKRGRDRRYDSMKEGDETKRGRDRRYDSMKEGDETKRGRERRYDSMKEGDETKRGRDRRYDSMKEGDETKRGRERRYDSMKEGDETKRGRDRRYDSMKEGDETKRGRERRYDSMKEGDETKRGRDRRYDSMKERDETKRGRERRSSSTEERDETKRGRERRSSSTEERDETKRGRERRSSSTEERDETKRGRERRSSSTEERDEIKRGREKRSSSTEERDETKRGRERRSSSTEERDETKRGRERRFSSTEERDETKRGRERRSSSTEERDKDKQYLRKNKLEKENEKTDSKYVSPPKLIESSSNIESEHSSRAGLKPGTSRSRSAGPVTESSDFSSESSYSSYSSSEDWESPSSTDSTDYKPDVVPTAAATQNYNYDLTAKLHTLTGRSTGVSQQRPYFDTVKTEFARVKRFRYSPLRELPGPPWMGCTTRKVTKESSSTSSSSKQGEADPKILAQEYIQSNGIYELFQLLTTKLIIETPDKPLDFLIQTVRDIIFTRSALEV